MTDFWWVPSAVLLAVASHHRWRVHSIRQSAWKGGGFGMFSEIQRSSIAVVLWVIDGNGDEVPIKIDPSQSQTVMSVIPTPENLLRWGRAVVQSKWQRCGDFAHTRPQYSGAMPLRITKVTLRHLRVNFDSCRGAYTVEECGGFTLDSDGRIIVSL
jgi:hypothetical protein